MDLTQASFDEKLTALFALSDSSLTFAISPLVSQSVLCTASLSDKNRHPPSNFDKSFVKDNNHTIIQLYFVFPEKVFYQLFSRKIISVHKKNFLK